MRRTKTRQTRGCMVLLLVIIGSLAMMTSCRRLFLAKGRPDYEGEFQDLPLTASVKVLRDEYGIPHIYAENKHDLLLAQGFVHAQDRLWQMEILRRVVSGRLAEISGEERVKLDYFTRLLGFPELRRRGAHALDPEEIALIQAYVDGINANIRLRSKDLPLEFQSVKHVPEEFTVEDALSLFILNTWMFRENYRPELMALLARQSVEPQEWKDICPSHRGANLPDDAYYEDLRSLKIGPIYEAALSRGREDPGNG